MRLNLSNKKYFLLCILLLCLPSNSKNQEYLPFKNNQSFKSEIKIASNENVESVIVIGSGLSIENSVLLLNLILPIFGLLSMYLFSYTVKKDYIPNRIHVEDLSLLTLEFLNKKFKEKILNISDQKKVSSYDAIKFVCDELNLVEPKVVRYDTKKVSKTLKML